MAQQERALDNDLSHIQKLLTEMGQKVQYMLEQSMQALVDRNTRLAEEIIQFDKEVDELELQIDQAIYELIALRQPTAGDLRDVLAGIKINNDLERIGDYCEGICKQGISLNLKRPMAEGADLVVVAGLVKKMLGDCIMAYTSKDPQLAKKTIFADDDVDDLTFKFFDKIHHQMKTDPSTVEAGSALLLVSAKLERIADQATNICEEVIFSVTGDNIRHRAYIFSVEE
jgi:phosphate transport system protein